MHTATRGNDLTHEYSQIYNTTAFVLNWLYVYCVHYSLNMIQDWLLTFPNIHVDIRDMLFLQIYRYD